MGIICSIRGEARRDGLMADIFSIICIVYHRLFGFTCLCVCPHVHMSTQEYRDGQHSDNADDSYSETSDDASDHEDDFDLEEAKKRLVPLEYHSLTHPWQVHCG